jgi:hypothetical protein
MRPFQIGLAAAALCLGLGAAANAQDWDHRAYGYYREATPGGGQLFWHVRDDLDRVQATTFPDGRDRRRFDHTRHELNELQDQFSRGRYDRGELNDVINALRSVVADNRMSPRDRELLNDDLGRLYEFRERHEHWGR